MDTLFGLPAHPLVIHAPIVLLPIAALLTVAFAARSVWRHRAGWWMVGGLFAILVLLFLAKESGEALDDAFDGAVDASRHESLADTTFILAIVWFVLYTAMVVIERRSSRTASSLSAAGSDATPAELVTIGLSVAACIVAGLATVWLVRTGHAGTDLVWGPTVDILFAD